MGFCPLVCGLGLVFAWIFLPKFVRLLQALYAFHFARRFNRLTDLSQFGKWAVVTGSSDGIGKAYAFELADRGLDLILVSRTESKLQQVAKDIEAKHPERKVRIVVADFEKLDKLGYAEVFGRIKDVADDVGVLVNNAGIAGDVCNFHEYKEQTPGDFAYDIVQVNIQALAQFAGHFLPLMVQKNRGLIVNVSSSAALTPTPLICVYGATKSFVRYFSNGLRWELRNTKVEVQTVMPCAVLTNIMKPGMRRAMLKQSVTPEHFAHTACDSIGILGETYGCMYHTLQGLVMEILREVLPLSWLQCLLQRAMGRLVEEAKKDE